MNFNRCSYEKVLLKQLYTLLQITPSFGSYFVIILEEKNISVVREFLVYEEVYKVSF